MIEAADPTAIRAEQRELEGTAGAERLLADLGFPSGPEASAALWEALDTLPERPSLAVMLRYGLDDGDFRTYREVGLALPPEVDSDSSLDVPARVSDEEVRSLTAIGMAKLRMVMEVGLPKAAESAPSIIVV